MTHVQIKTDGGGGGAGPWSLPCSYGTDKEWSDDSLTTFQLEISIIMVIVITWK